MSTPVFIIVMALGYLLIAIPLAILVGKMIGKGDK